jgi:hypothetical protein
MALVVLGVISSCAARTAANSRAAFETARESPEGKAGAGGGKADGTVTDPDLYAKGWARVQAILDVAARELATGDLDRVLGLAGRWCATEPNPQETPHGPVSVCYPEPPIQAGGHGFTLEMGDGGMLGLVSTGLDGAESEALVQEARREGDAWCLDPWTPVSSPEDAYREFHTCSVEGGAILAVGRLPRDLEADLWQVSVTLLGAT